MKVVGTMKKRKVDIILMSIDVSDKVFELRKVLEVPKVLR
jgi:hypothetical protein